MYSRRNDTKRLNSIYDRKYNTLNDRGYEKNNVNVVMGLQVLPQNIPLLWQPVNHKNIVSISEYLRSQTIIMVNFN